MNSILQPAPDWQGFRERGWNAFGLPSHSKTPNAPWKRWQTERSSLEDHRRWEAEGCNAAIVTGSASGLLVLDCDTPEAIAEAERLGINGAPSVKTAKGAHYYFAHPGGQIGNRAGLLPGMDLRGDGGFVVAPGSIHPSGVRYEWQTPPDGDLPPVPRWLLDAVTQKPSEAAPAAPPKKPPTYASPYGLAALRSEIETMRAAPEGTRNHQLNKSAFALAQLAASGDVAESEATAELRQAALEAGLEPDEVDTTLASGWKAGLASPRIGRAHKPLVLPGIISATDLIAKTFAPLQWIIPNLLPEGLALLAGKPKAGKSFFTLQICLAVSSGDYSSLGGGQGFQGDVIYFALEDSERRLKDRLLAMTLGQAPTRLEFSTAAPRINEGFVEEAVQWCEAKANPRLIVIDTFRIVKPAGKGGQQVYDQDAQALAPLLDFVRTRPGLCLLVIHHVRKMDSDDPFDTISGSTGLTGVCDTLMVLRKDPLGASLFGQGRDLEPFEKALERDLRTGGWIIKGDPVPKAKTGERQELLDLLVSAAGPMPLAKLASATGKGADGTRHLLKGLIEEGHIHQPRHGMYALTKDQIPQFTPFVDISIF